MAAIAGVAVIKAMGAGPHWGVAARVAPDEVRDSAEQDDRAAGDEDRAASAQAAV